MAKTFCIIRDTIDPYEWRLVTDEKYVWACVLDDFFSDAATPYLAELVADETVQSIECIITTRAHYDVLMAEAARGQAED